MPRKNAIWKREAWMKDAWLTAVVCLKAATSRKWRARPGGTERRWGGKEGRGAAGRVEGWMNITIIECDGKWRRRSLFSRCLTLKIKGKKEQRSSPGTPAGSRSEEFRERASGVLLEWQPQGAGRGMKNLHWRWMESYCSIRTVNNSGIQRLNRSFAHPAELHIRCFGSSALIHLK